MSEKEDPKDSPKMVQETKIVVDKDSEGFYEYQSKLQKYIDSKCKYNDNLQKCLNIILE